MSRRVEYDSQIVVRCTREERDQWKALADRLDQAKAAELRRGGITWRFRDQHITVSALIRQLLEDKAKATPAAGPAAPAQSRRRRRNAAAAARLSAR